MFTCNADHSWRHLSPSPFLPLPWPKGKVGSPLQDISELASQDPSAPVTHVLLSGTSPAPHYLSCQTWDKVLQCLYRQKQNHSHLTSQKKVDSTEDFRGDGDGDYTQSMTMDFHWLCLIPDSSLLASSSTSPPTPALAFPYPSTMQLTPNS